MRIFTFLLTLALCACNNTLESGPGADKLTRLESVPAECVYLYQLDADANFYSEADAIRYVENRIAAASGNSYLIKSQEKRQNQWKPFAPEYSYSIIADVYDCASA